MPKLANTLETFGITGPDVTEIKTKKKRFERIDKQHRILELELDGICTHIDTATDCPLKGTDFHKKLNMARLAIRSARDVFRIDSGTKQWTLTTRGGTNRHGLWHMQVIRNWKCPYCHTNSSERLCMYCLKPMVKSFGIYDCEKCGNHVCETVFGEGYPLWEGPHWDSKKQSWYYNLVDIDGKIIEVVDDKEFKERKHTK